MYCYRANDIVQVNMDIGVGCGVGCGMSSIPSSVYDIVLCISLPYPRMILRLLIIPRFLRHSSIVTTKI